MSLLDSPSEVLELLDDDNLEVRRKSFDLGYQTHADGTQKVQISEVLSPSEKRLTGDTDKPWDAVIARLEELLGVKGCFGNKTAFFVLQDRRCLFMIEMRDSWLKTSVNVELSESFWS